MRSAHAIWYHAISTSVGETPVFAPLSHLRSPAEHVAGNWLRAEERTAPQQLLGLRKLLAHLSYRDGPRRGHRGLVFRRLPLVHDLHDLLFDEPDVLIDRHSRLSQHRASLVKCEWQVTKLFGQLIGLIVGDVG